MNIRQVRKKIKSIGNIKKITKAMELVSAIKMKKSQKEAVEGQPYMNSLLSIIKNITQIIDPKLSPLLKENSATKKLVILISTNKGLCGSFNYNLFRFSLKNIDFKKDDFIVLGKEGGFLISQFKGDIIADFSSNNPTTTVSAIFDLALRKFLANEYSSVSLIYNRFISSLRYEPTIEKILPIKFKESDLGLKNPIKAREEYTIEPSPKEIIDPLLKNFVEQAIRNAVVSSQAGEHSARMVAMKNATDNAGHLIYDFTLLRNKLRQEKITYELLDMITAKESVEN